MKTAAVQRWLTAYCEDRADVAGALVACQAAAGGDYEAVARHPPQGAMHAALTSVAREAARRGSSLIMVPAVVQSDAGYTRVVAVPLKAGAGVSAGVSSVVAVAVRSPDIAVARRLLEDVERVGGSLMAALSAPADTVAAAPAAAASAGLLGLLDIAAAESGATDGADPAACALLLANRIAADFRYDRVSVSLRRGVQWRIAAISHAAQADARQELVRDLLAAHAEAGDQDATVCHPPGLQGAARITLQHARVAAQSGTALCSTPLRAGHAVIGVLTCERKGTTAFSGEECLRCEAVARVVGPVLALKQAAARSAWSRASGAAQAWWQARNRSGRRIAVALLALALPVLLLVPVTFNVGAPARVEGAFQRVIAAPMDGYVRQTHVRPGDSVRKNDVLVELADQDLLLEKRRWESELARHETNFSAALGRSDRAQFAVNFAHAAEARAQLDLVEQQLARAQVTAPMDALVISGDLTQMIGAPVKRGDTLLTLAPRDQYRIIIDVDDRDIGFVALGQHGRLALGALPGETLPITVQRITPVATVTRDGHNVYAVEARLEAGGVAPRHGLQGIAKIETQKRTLGWILSRRVLGWIRLSVWGWLP